MKSAGCFLNLNFVETPLSDIAPKSRLKGSLKTSEANFCEAKTSEANFYEANV